MPIVARDSSWAPANDSAHDLYVERTNLDGFLIGPIGYGAQIVIVFMCWHGLLQLRRTQPRLAISLLVYVTVMFILGTIGNATNIKLPELAFVDNRDYPGGPNAYLIEQGSLIPVNILSYAVYIVATWMQDGLLLYRFMAVYGWNWWYFIIPGLVYLVSIIMSCFLLAQLAQAGAPLFSAATFDFALAYWASSIATTLLLTILIVGRLGVLRYQLRRALGPKNGNDPYLSISAMLVESAVLYSFFAVVFIILYAKNDPFQNLIFPLLGQIQMIAPELIILRVASGRENKPTTYSANQGSRLQASTGVVISMSKLTHLDRGSHIGSTADVNGGEAWEMGSGKPYSGI